MEEVSGDGELTPAGLLKIVETLFYSTRSIENKKPNTGNGKLYTKFRRRVMRIVVQNAQQGYMRVFETETEHLSS